MVWARLLAYATGAINREPHSENEGEGAVGPFRRRKSHARRDRSSARPQGLEGSGLDGATRYHSGLVSETHRPEVRWVEVLASFSLSMLIRPNVKSSTTLSSAAVNSRGSPYSTATTYHPAPLGMAHLAASIKVRCRCPQR